MLSTFTAFVCTLLAASPARAHDEVHAPGSTPVPAAPSATPLPGGAGIVLVPRGWSWRYRDDGVDPGTAWRMPGFDDRSWRVGRGHFGYGDGDEDTVVSFGPNPLDKYVTTYFRTVFAVHDETWFRLAHVDLRRDDGVVVYLNGVEIARNNMPSGPVSHGTLALQAVSNGEENVFRAHSFPPGVLTAGVNVLAVEVHQVSRTSTDLSFDLELVATAQPSVSRGPYLQLGTPGGATVRWRTDAPLPSGLWIGSSPTSLALVAADGEFKTEHELRAANLTPNTTYYYAVGDGIRPLVAGPGYRFTTAPPVGSAQPTRIWVLGDAGKGDANQRAVRDAYYAFTGSRGTDMVLLLGDNVYEWGTDWEYQAAFFDTYPTVLRSTFVWPSFGNHDAMSARSATQSGVYYDSFTLPAGGEAGGAPSGTEAYYSFDWGNVHCICLDSEGSDRTPTGPMMRWLAADLATTTAEWVIAYFHHPPYTRGSHDSDNPLADMGRMRDMREVAVPILEAFGVDLVLTGHSHSYERSYLLDGHYGVSSTLALHMKRDRGDGREQGDGGYVKLLPGRAPRLGAVYVVSGSAGSVGPGTFDHPAHVVAMPVLGSLVLDVDGRRLDGRFLDSRGNVRDHFTIVKGPERWLVRDAPALSFAAGGTQTLTLVAGPAHAHRPYLVAGSLGSSPGFVHRGVTVPLNFDLWFTTTLQFANSAVLQGTVGRLDAQGLAQARILVPPLPALFGVDLYHAAMAFSAGQLVAASNAVKLRLQP